MDAETTIQSYYDALRSGEPLSPFFQDTESLVKFGINEHLDGYADVKAGLQHQTETTTDWRVTSQELRVTERSCHAWFSDLVTMEWRNTTTAQEYDFDTRWTGTLEPTEDAWEFVQMHVSTPNPH